MRKLLSITLLLPLFFVLFSSITLAQENVTINRIAGIDRFTTAIEISKKGWTTSDTVILAYYNGYADALTASPLAYQKNAPILLTESDSLTKATKNEILRLSAKNVIVVGGEGVINEKVVTELLNMNIQVERIGGSDRFDTAHQISQQLNTSETAIIAYGLNFPDALAIGPYAAKNGFPILLVEKDRIPEKTIEALKGKARTVVIGGSGVVGNTVYNNLPSPKRIYGSDRFSTAVEIIKQLNMSTDKVYMATGMGYADALTGAVLAAKENAPILLGMKDQLPSDIQKVIDERNITNFTILGGTGVISNTLVTKLQSQNVLSGKVIVLDAGHGPYDPGALGVLKDGLTEEDYNLQLVNRIKTKLSAYNPTIYIAPRNTSKDSKQSLKDRVNFANSKNADIFISIHHDSSTSSSPDGVSTHYSSYRPGIAGSTDDAYVVYNGSKYPFIKEVDGNVYFEINGEIKYVSINNIIVFDPTPTEAAQKSKVLAESLARDISSLGLKTAYTSNGSRDHNLYVTRWTNMPSVLIENGFISNPDEAKKVTDPIMQDKTAQVIVNNILEFFSN